MTNRTRSIGRYIKSSAIAGETYCTYLPPPLRSLLPLDMAGLYPLLDQANIAIGRLDGMSTTLSDASLFLYMYIRKEAVLSSQIEGTQSSLYDLLQFETTGTTGQPIDDVTEVVCYVSAMNYGLERIRELPLSLRLIREIHAQLMNNARGGRKQPGEFRRSQNWIGGSRPGNARFVPPPPEHLMECLDQFEKFLHDDAIKLPALVKVALAHVQFETIHPFLDGNGRLGRLLITLTLCVEGIVPQPLLYLSLYFKSNRQRYYNHLQSIRETGDWESWIRFFLTGVIETAEQAIETAHSILDLFEKDRAKIEASGKSTAAVLTVHHCLQSQPVATTAKIRDSCHLSLPTILGSFSALESLDIVQEITGRDRHKVFVHDQFLGLLQPGTEPLSS